MERSVHEEERSLRFRSGCNATTMTETPVGRQVQLPASVAGVLLLSEMPGSKKSLVNWLADAEATQISLIVNLAQEEELASISPEYLRYIQNNEGIEILRFPIPDFSVPADMAAFHIFVGKVVERLHLGQRVVVHCRAGIGRSGLFAASLLTNLEMPSDDVLLRVQSAGGRLEADAQRSFVEAYGEHLTGGSSY
ncbi:MAG TPA: hypothetical protein EYQ00_11490 [Dehalococcoidia bacterium]|nr:hypothetical protein [Dehalococcoidia bacterium]